MQACAWDTCSTRIKYLTVPATKGHQKPFTNVLHEERFCIQSHLILGAHVTTPSHQALM